MTTSLYDFDLPAGGHWSLRVRRGLTLTLTDRTGSANVGMLLYNPEQLLERYNAPDTLKCQHTFKLSAGHCLYSDMGRVFCSVVEDSLGWHDTVCGNSTAPGIAARFGARDYQTMRNDWHQNGEDAFLVELEKYGLGPRDLAANVNWFSKVATDANGRLQWQPEHSRPGAQVVLRFEMDSLVVLHNCPHPLAELSEYPRGAVGLSLAVAAPLGATDICRDHCDENRRGFANNALYYLGEKA